MAFLSVFLFAGLLAAQGRYQKWLEEDVVYIITAAERQAFQHLNTGAERDRFIDEFWSRRNPAPADPLNPLKEEHYRRIAYANERFAAAVPGWKSDRGRVYIVFGPPDEIESHCSGGSSAPSELWRYQHVEGRGAMTFDFVDSTLTGEYRLMVEPEQRDALFRPGAEGTSVPPVGLQFYEKQKSLSVTIDLAKRRFPSRFSQRPPLRFTAASATQGITTCTFSKRLRASRFTSGSCRFLPGTII